MPTADPVTFSADLAKHVSTLSLAALVLFLALVDSFRQTLIAGGPTTMTTGALLQLGASLVLSVLGLLLFRFGSLLHSILVVISYAAFCLSMMVAMLLY